MNLPETMRAWRIHEYGEPLAVMKLEEVTLPTIQPGQVLVRAEGIPLNLNDLERIRGGNMMVKPAFPYSPGMEIMGTVAAVGDGAEQWLGKRVAGITDGAHGGYAEFCVCPQGGVFEVPAEIPLPDAAALFFPFHLAWLGLHDRAHIQSGDYVLIHAAAGGSGSAAIQLAKHAGAMVIALASTPEKLALCESLGADKCINYKDVDFTAEVLAFTQGKGVDIVFDNVGEAVWESSFKCLAYNGRYLMMGFASNKLVADEPFVVPRQLALANAGLFGVMLSYADDGMVTALKSAMGWNFPERELGESIQRSICNLYREGAVKTVIGEHVTFEQLPASIQAMADRKTQGRIVATF